MKFILVSLLCLAISPYVLCQVNSGIRVSEYKKNNFDRGKSLPIKPARTVSFTTDEGSFMNVDLSPDGKTLVFDLLGDLYTLPAHGGVAKQLTRGVAINKRPAWSPDGKRIAYLSDATGMFRLHVADAKFSRDFALGINDKEPAPDKITPVWFAGGNYVSIRDSVYSLFGGQTRNDTIGTLLRFSITGDSAYFLRSGYIVRKNRTTGIVHTIAKLSDKVENRYFSQSGFLSPDARYWVYYVDEDLNGDQSLWVRDLVKGDDRMLVDHLTTTPWTFFGYVFNVSFSPDSKSVFTAYKGKIHRIVLESGSDEIIPMRVNVQSDLGALNYNAFRLNYDSIHVKYTRWARKSSDGKQIVYSALNRLYVQDETGHSKILVNQPYSQSQPAYSPDGKWIVYTTWSDTSAGYVWKVPSTGGEPEKLTTIPGQYYNPTWSPDGKSIAVIRQSEYLDLRFSAPVNSVGQLIILDVKLRTVRLIEKAIPFASGLTFSRDGAAIFYQPFFERTLKPTVRNVPLLTSAKLDGSEKQIVAVGMQSYKLNQITISPNGRFLVYKMAEDLYLLPLTKTGSPEVIYDTLQKLPLIRFGFGTDHYWDSSNNLCWSYANKHYQINPNNIINNAENFRLQYSGFVSTKFVPDRVIDLHLSVGASFGKGIIALAGVRIVTMQQNFVLEHGTIIIKDGRIEAIGSEKRVIIPSSAKVYRLDGLTVIPGFIDLHLHLDRSDNLLPQQPWKWLASLAYGVTTARDPASSFNMFSHKEMLESGNMIGPRFYSVGDAIYTPRHNCNEKIENLEDATRIVEKKAMIGAQVIKQYGQQNRLHRQLLLLGSREFGLNMTNEGEYDPYRQIAMLKDGTTGIEHTAVWGEPYKDVVSLLVASGTTITPTFQVVNQTDHAMHFYNRTYWLTPDEKLKRFVPDLDNSRIRGAPADTFAVPKFVSGPGKFFKKLYESGGRIGMGSHGNDIGTGPHSEIWALHDIGLSKMEALQCATITGAQAMGLQKDLGSLEVGKIADLIILSKNPLDDIHNTREIKYVMKDGILYNADTMDQLWPVFKKCPEWRLKPELTNPKN